MTTSEVETIQYLWPALTERLFVPHTEQESKRLVAILDTLIDVVGEHETHPLASYMEVVGVLIEHYEDEHVPELAAR